MAESNLAKHLRKVRSIIEKKQGYTEYELRVEFRKIWRELQKKVGNEYLALYEGGVLDFPAKNKNKRLDAFLKQILDVFATGSSVIPSKLVSLAEEAYTLSYEGMVQAASLQTGSRILSRVLNDSFLRPEVLKKALNKRLHPLVGYTGKWWKKLEADLRRDITNGMLANERMEQMSFRIQKRINMNYRRAVLVARTEVHRLRECGFHDVAKDVNDVLKDASAKINSLPPEPVLPKTTIVRKETGKLSKDQIIEIVVEEEEDIVDVPTFQMTKVWQSMQDERVRKTNKANHQKMNGKIVAVDDLFNLGHNIKTDSPGNSGNAANDINCRCLLEYYMHEVIDDDTTKDLRKSAKELANLL